MSESPLLYPLFRNTWIADLISRLGTFVQVVAVSWMMVTLTGSPLMVSLVQTATALPVLLFVLVAGALADTIDRRKLMISAQSFMLLVSIAFAAFALEGALTPWLLLFFTFLIGCGTALYAPAWQASVSEMVPRHVLPAAVAYNSMGFNVARSTGPALGGAIVAAAGVATAMVVNAFSYLGLIVMLLRWRRAHAPSPLPRQRLSSAIADGVRYVAMSPTIVWMLIRSALFGTGAGALLALLPLLAQEASQGGPLAYGFLLGAFGVGAVAGVIPSSALRRRFPAEVVLRGAVGASAFASLLCATTQFLPLYLVASLIAGAAWVLALTTFNVNIQMSTPRWVAARALAIYQMAAYGGVAFGGWLWGAAAQETGLPSVLLISALVTALSAALGIRCRLARPEMLDLNPLGRWRAPDVAMDIRHCDGPVVVTVEYLIADKDVTKFVSVMRERRRIRKRDGARRWGLLRDVEQPELWIETFQSPTWADYVRQAERVTQTDAVTARRLQAMHKGNDRIKVRRMIAHPIASMQDAVMTAFHGDAPIG